MANEKPPRWWKRLNESGPTIKHCKWCFKDFDENWLDTLLLSGDPHFPLCHDCFRKLMPNFESFSLAGYRGLAIYAYDETIQSLLHRFKNQGDRELGVIFLSPYRHYLRLRYRGFWLVAIPSASESMEERGFNTLQEIFGPLRLPFVDLLIKDTHYKQSRASRAERWRNRHHLQLRDHHFPTGQKLLLIDDVMSTGATLIAALEKLKIFAPSKMEILVMSKNPEKRR